MLGYSNLLTEECAYEKYNGQNKYNENTYDDVIYLKCYSSFMFENDRLIKEQNVNITEKIFILNEFTPNPKDKINGLEIKSIKPVKGLLVSVIGWEILI